MQLRCWNCNVSDRVPSSVVAYMHRHCVSYATIALAAASDVRRALRLLVLLLFVPDFGPADGPTGRRIFPGSEKGPVPARRCMHGDVCSAVATSLQELELDVLTLNVMNRVAIRHVPSGT